MKINLNYGSLFYDIGFKILNCILDCNRLNKMDNCLIKFFLFNF